MMGKHVWKDKCHSMAAPKVQVIISTSLTMKMMKECMLETFAKMAKMRSCKDKTHSMAKRTGEIFRRISITMEMNVECMRRQVATIGRQLLTVLHEQTVASGSL